MLRLFISVYSEKQSQDPHESCTQERAAEVSFNIFNDLKNNNILYSRLAVGQKRYSGVFMDGTAANNDPFDLRSTFHQK